MIARAPLKAALTPMQAVCVDLVGLFGDYRVVADLLGLGYYTVREYINAASKKMHGDLPPQLRVMVWARGASLDVLEGTTLRNHVSSVALARVHHTPSRGSTRPDRIR